MWNNKVNMFKTVLWMSIIVPIMLTLTLFGANPVKIMPLGDSITHGANFSTVNTPEETNTSISYRGSLWTKLSAGGYNVDFVGSQKSGNDYQATDPSFDLDHEARSGDTAVNINMNVTNYLTANPADIVLLHIGTNDLFDTSVADTVAEVNSTLEKIDSISQGIKVILARIINRDTNNTKTTNFNNQLNTMAEKRIANGDDITIVDMENGAGIDYTTDMIDLLHPNATGYTKMADLWYSALTSVMTPTLPIALWKLDETAGSTYVDSYGGADGNCTDPGCPLPSTGQVYGAQTFDGVDDRIDITNTAAFDWTPDANATIEFWMKSNNTPINGLNDVMIGRSEGSTLFSDVKIWFIGVTYTNGYLKFGLGSSTGLQADLTLAEGTIPITNGEWNHIACVITSNTMKAYVNGQLDINVDRNGSGQPYIQGTPVTLGTLANFRNTNWSYKGQLDEITVYDTALSTGLIRQHFLNGFRPHLAEVAPVPTPTDNNTPDYTFSSDQAGNISYGGSCTSATTVATVGDNTITFDTLADGTYSDCTITVTNASNNASTPLAVTVFTVSTVVQDTTMPIITLLGSDPQVIIAGSSYTELGATAQDDVDGDISANIVIDASAVDTNTAGQYTVTYDVNDSAGNAAVQVTRTVNVVNTAEPVINPTATVTELTVTNSSGGGCSYNPDSKNFDMSFLLMMALGLFYPFRRRFIKQSSR